MSRKRRLLVELDVLLDTRLGTMASMGLSMKTLFSHRLAYWLRLSDDLTAVMDDSYDFQAYLKAYRERDVGVLKRSMMTHAVEELSTITRKLSIDTVRGVEYDDVEVVVNYHPYMLTVGQVELFKDALGRYLALGCKLTFVSYPPGDLDITTLGTQYDAYFMYNMGEWMRANHTSLHLHNQTTLELIVPSMWYERSVPDVKELTDETGNPIDPFRALQIAFVGTCGVDFVPSGMVSMVHPIGMDGILKEVDKLSRGDLPSQSPRTSTPPAPPAPDQAPE